MSQDDFEYEEEEDCCEFECIPLKSVFTGERESGDDGDGGEEVEKGFGSVRETLGCLPSSSSTFE